MQVYLLIISDDLQERGEVIGVYSNQKYSTGDMDELVSAQNSYACWYETHDVIGYSSCNS